MSPASPAPTAGSAASPSRDPSHRTAPPAASPLGAAYARIADLPAAPRVHRQAPRNDAGWITGGALAAGGPQLEEFLAREGARLLHGHGRQARPDVIATLGLHRYAWRACLLFTVPWFLQSRVPRIPVDTVAIHRTTGDMTVRAPSFACLPGDPAATHPAATVLPGEAELRAELRAAVAGHLAPVLMRFRPRIRRGPRALWGMVTDEIVEGLWYVGRLLGQEERAVSDLGALLPGDTAPYPGSAGFRRRPGAGPTRERLSCCLFYTVCSTEACVTCPRTHGVEPNCGRVEGC